tara:strand:+ start:3295 stop:3732 length:438 start_codon:yes stop_codon:yes gene_type:complete
MDNRRKEIMLGQSVNLANAACLQSTAYQEAATLEAKKEILHKAIDYYYEVIKEANEKHLPDNKMPYTSYGNKQDNYNPNKNDGSYQNKFSRPQGGVTDKQKKMIYAIIKNNQNIPLDTVEAIQEKIQNNTIERADIDSFAKSYGR